MMKKLLALGKRSTPCGPFEIDKASALWVVGSLASGARRPPPRLDLPEQLDWKDFKAAVGATVFNAQEASVSELLDESQSQEASRWLALLPGDTPVPAFIVGREGEAFRVVRKGEAQVTSVSIAELANAQSKRGLIKCTPVIVADEEALERFGWKWFAKEFFARKTVIRDVLLASLMVSLTGLGMPLATQAIVDKVITNQASSTLVALGLGIALMAVFSGAMGWIRQKLLLRLANVVDAELAQRVFDHLLHLPLGYYGNRATGTLINRCLTLHQ